MPDTASLLFGQFRYANHGFWRTPVAAFFTLVFPLSFLVILTAITGNAVIDPETGLRLAQYTTPVFAVFGVCMASYVSLAAAMAYARESGVLKRLRGTPLPPAIHLAGRIASALWISAITVVVFFAVGVGFYGVQIIWGNLPALLLTFLIGIACFAALGLAVAAAAPTPAAAQAFSNASLILLSFISGVFGFTELPAWMDRLAQFFPLAHFVDAAARLFNPYLAEPALESSDLAVMGAWAIAGGLVAWRYFRWEPPSRRRAAAAVGDVPESGEALGSGDAGGLRAPTVQGLVQRSASGSGESVAVGHTQRPRVGSLVGHQTRYCVLQVLRDPMSLFFAVIFPVLLVVFFSLIYGEDATWGGLPLAQYLAAAFAVYGVATSGYVNLPGSIADQRRLLVLKRLRGTPLPPWTYLAGRVLGTLGLGLVTVGMVFAVGVIFLGVSLPPSTWLATLLVFVLSTGCFATLGLALVSVLDAPQTVIAVALSTLLPLSFISDIFISTTELPPLLNAIGWAFPLRHATNAAVAASSGAALDSAFWLNLAAVAAWAIVGAVVAQRWFHWEPRRTRVAHRQPASSTTR